MTKQQIKHKQVNFKVTDFQENGADEKYYYFEGYASVFGNIDSYGDVIVKGAFLNSLNKWKAKGKMPKLCWQHRMDKVIGTIYEAFEDDNGLFIKCILPKKHSLASDVAALLECGAINEMSIGYMEVTTSEEMTDGVEITYVKEVDLWETSIVTRAANEEAMITSFKSYNNFNGIETITDIEDILKEAEFSAKQAKTLISKIKQFSSRDDEDNSQCDAENQDKLLKFIEDATLNRKILNKLK